MTDEPLARDSRADGTGRRAADGRAGCARGLRGTPMTAPIESARWPETIGRLVLTGAIAKMYASYVDDLTGREYRAGREQGGRYRRGWWVLAVAEDTRSGGYRDFSPVNQEAAIRRLRSLASASVGTGEWATVSIEPGEQAALDAWEVSA